MKYLIYSTLIILCFKGSLEGVECADLVGPISPPAGAFSAEIVSATASTEDPIVTTNNIPHCLVSGKIDFDPSQNSVINFRMRLPDNWNGKFFMASDGGLGGDEKDEGFLTVWGNSTLSVLEKGYATATSDTGHVGGTAMSFLDSPPNPGVNNEGEINFFEARGDYLTSIAAKAIIANYYETDGPSFSYLHGCSRGGWAALNFSLLYPNVFDGIIAGAPTANGSTAKLTEIYQGESEIFGQFSLPVPGFEIYYPQLIFNKLDSVTQAAIAKCDSYDGVLDGILEDPRECDFDPLVDLPLCASESDTHNLSCFTTAQAALVKSVYQDIEINNLGDKAFGYEISSEGQRALFNNTSVGWTGWSISDPILPYAIPGISVLSENFVAEFGRYVYFDDPTLDYKSFMLTTSIEDIYSFEQLLFFPGSETYPKLDLTAFRKNKGKLLLLQGWIDPSTPPEGTINVYNDLQENTQQSINNTARLYMAPGVGHCSGGSGASQFDFLSVMEGWVEQDIKPQEIVATNSTASFSRKLCPYPKKAVVIDPNGDMNSASNFECEKEDDQ